MAHGSIPTDALSGLAPRAGVATTCPYCGVGCGVVMRPDPGAASGWAAAGDPDHPANFGRLCSKGTALGETLDLDGRLLHPMVGAEPVSWPAAIGAAAERFKAILERDGPDAVAFYLSGQLLTEDYYVANKLIKGFIGSPHVDTNSRLCMASSVAGHKRAFGADVVPGNYDDLDRADLLILVGSNAAWCHPVLWRRMVANRDRRGARIVVIDPRASATSAEADLHLPIAPGMDAALFDGLLAHLAATDRIDRGFIDAHTNGFDETRAAAAARTGSVAATAAATGLDAADVQRLFDWFAATPNTVTLYSQGVNQSAQGTDKVNAILNCHLATGRIGRPGQGPFSLTGQPNAMGGREVGGLANQLAAHMDYSEAAVDRVGRFWRAPTIATAPGLKAVELFDAIEAGRIKALWVMATNPAASLPEADRVRRALGRLELLVVSETIGSNETIAGAHVRFPAAAWGEKNGTVTNSERRISRQRPFLDLPGEARPDWWIVTELAKAMGFGAAFDFASPAAIYREHAALSAFENDRARAFDIGAHAGLDAAGYDAMIPTHWPIRAAPAQAGEQRGPAGTARLFADGGFFTTDGRARFVSPAAPALAAAVSPTWPMLLNTGRVRDQWHTMTRSGKSPSLGQHVSEPFVAIHGADATRLGLVDGGLARIANAGGACVLRVRVEPGQPPGTLFAPIHWTAETASAARVGALIASRVDPVSGQPELKAAPVAIGPVALGCEAVVLSAAPLDASRLDACGAAYWARARVTDGWATFIALEAALEAPRAWTAALIGGDTDGLTEISDEAGGIFRAARLDGDRLVAVVAMTAAPERPRWAHLKSLLGDRPVAGIRRRALLAGRSLDGFVDPGPTVCACFGVGASAIHAAIDAGAADVAALGKCLKAGTNCGSCLPELRRMVAATAVASAA